MDVATIQLLIDHNADVNAVIAGNGNTRLHYEADPDIIQCLIQNGADVTMQNKDGCTALHVAREGAVTLSLLNTLANVLQAMESTVTGTGTNVSASASTSASTSLFNLIRRCFYR
jgi:hypothetical protein